MTVPWEPCPSHTCEQFGRTQKNFLSVQAFSKTLCKYKFHILPAGPTTSDHIQHDNNTIQSIQYESRLNAKFHWIKFTSNANAWYPHWKAPYFTTAVLKHVVISRISLYCRYSNCFKFQSHVAPFNFVTTRENMSLGKVPTHWSLIIHALRAPSKAQPRPSKPLKELVHRSEWLMGRLSSARSVVLLMPSAKLTQAIEHPLIFSSRIDPSTSNSIKQKSMNQFNMLIWPLQ